MRRRPGHLPTLLRHPPSGELVLLWRPGPHGLVLVANEAQFPEPALLALAESAR